MSSALDRLLQRKAASEAPKTEAETPPAPAQEETPVQVAQRVEPEETTALSTLPQDAKAALTTLSTLMGEIPAALALSAIGSELASEGGRSHTLPFASIRKGNWVSDKSVPEHIADHMPAGSRGYPCIYLAQRLGAVGWEGSGSAGSGAPPKWSFVLPTLRTSLVEPAVVAELSRNVLKVGRKVQFTPSDDRVKFDTVGRLTPELQLLVWTPEAQFVVLIIPGYSPTQNTLDKLRQSEIEQTPGAPVRFAIEEEEVRNQRVMKTDPTAKNAVWTDHYVSAALDAGPTGSRLLEAWKALRESDPVTLANTLKSFVDATDYAGLSVEAVAELLESYSTNGLV